MIVDYAPSDIIQQMFDIMSAMGISPMIFVIPLMVAMLGRIVNMLSRGSDFTYTPRSKPSPSVTVRPQERPWHYRHVVKVKKKTVPVTHCQYCGTSLSSRNCKRCGGSNPHTKIEEVAVSDYIKVYDDEA